MFKILDRVKVASGFGKYSDKIGRIFYISENPEAYFVEFPDMNPRYFIRSELTLIR